YAPTHGRPRISTWAGSSRGEPGHGDPLAHSADGLVNVTEPADVVQDSASRRAGAQRDHPLEVGGGVDVEAETGPVTGEFHRARGEVAAGGGGSEGGRASAAGAGPQGGGARTGA